jgi:hypothetical protein
MSKPHCIRVDDSEWERWESVAKAAGMSVSEWVRLKCGPDTVTLTGVPAETRERLQETAAAAPSVPQDASEPIEPAITPTGTRKPRGKRLCPRCARLGVACCPACKG